MGMLFINILDYALLCAFAIFSWYRFNGKPVEFRNYKLYLSFLIGTVGCTIINFYLPQATKMILMVSLLFILCYFFFCNNITKSVIMVILTEIIVVICEYGYLFEVV